MTDLTQIDAVLLNDWMPVAAVSELQNGSMLATQLLGINLVIWRDSSGLAHAWEDRCPHRGMKLSMGHVCVDKAGADHVVCPYHGWQYSTTGKCQYIPAIPQLKADNLKAQVKTFALQQQYGLIWVCLGESAAEILLFPEFHDSHLRTVVCGAYEVESSAPRLIENFLDMAHFGFVHTGILGEENHTEIKNYTVESFDDAEYGSGIWAKQCYAWQPQPNKAATTGSEVEYSYRVVRPLSAILTKEPQAQDGFREAIALFLQPINETLTHAWVVLAMTDFEHSEEELRHFQDTIFMQDKPIVENQQPLKLPLVVGMEISVACDKMSLAYRRYLSDLGLRYGTITES